MSEARSRFVDLIAHGSSIAAARREVGVSRSTGNRWMNGHTVQRKNGTVVRVPALEPGATRLISARFLSQEERIVIADLASTGATVRSIAKALGRAPSTVSRELRRGIDEQGRYRPYDAHRRAAVRRRRPRSSRFVTNVLLLSFVRDHLERRWSPAQISRELHRQHPDDRTMWVAPESIYQEIYRPGSLLHRRRDIPSWLRTRRDHRCAHRRLGARRRRFAGPMLMITDRPFDPSDRTVAGHWEGDLIVGPAHRSAIGTLVERRTRYVKLVHLTACDSTTLHEALVRTLGPLPLQLRRSLTWDQGTEMARHLDTAARLGAKVYFCEPASPWQRGSNENTNGLLRQYFPKGTNLSVHTVADLPRVELELNQRPRAVLDDRPPAELFAQLLASTSQPPLR